MLTNDIEKLYESCATYEQLKSAIIVLLKDKGEDTSEKRLKVLLRGLFGGAFLCKAYLFFRDNFLGLLFAGSVGA